MDPALVADLTKFGLALGFAIIAIRWLVEQFRDVREKMDTQSSNMQARCDDERKALSAEIAKLRDAHAQDQREILLAATTALADVAKTNRELVGIHERRDGSGTHPTKQA